MIYSPPAVEHQEANGAPFVLGQVYITPTWADQPDDESMGSGMTYAPPAVEFRQPIDEAFVLGVVYFTPTWTDQTDQRDRDR